MVPSEQNEPWLSSVIDLLHQLFQNIMKILPSENIYLLGFSQGACLTSEVTARFAKKYGGIVVFTCGFIGGQQDIENYKGLFERTNIYLSNGNNDPHVPLSRSEKTRQQQQKMGPNVELDIYPDRPHTILPREIEKAKAFIFNS
jgi:phospholipase/carboxylesterase